MTPKIHRICRTIRRLPDAEYECGRSDYMAEILEKLGLDVIGSGMFGVVIDCGDFVFKVFTADDEAYLDFLDFCENVDSKHLPVILWDQQINAHWWGVCLEKLTTLEEDIDEVPTSLTKHPMFQHACKRIRDGKRNTGSKELNALLDLLAETCYREEHFIDLHNGNAMLRDRTLVITDPWC